MSKCKFCQAEMTEEDKDICPQCGKSNSEEMEDVIITRPLPKDVQQAIDAMELNDMPVEAPVEAEPEAVAEVSEAQEVQEPAEQAEETAEEPQEENKEEAQEEDAGEAAEESQEAPVKKATPGKIAAAVAAIVVLAAVLVALILAGTKGKQTAEPEQTDVPAASEQAVTATTPADGNPDDVTCKGSYTVSDEEAVAAMDTVVAKIGDEVLSNGELQVYYWTMVSSYLNSEMGNMLMMYGILDYTQPLDTMMCFEDETLTWQQYFLQEGLNFWQLSKSLALESAKAGYTVTEEDQAYLDSLGANLEMTAASYGMSLEELMHYNVGPGAGVDEYVAFQRLSAEGKGFYQDKLKEMVPTQEELEAFFDEHADGYSQSGITKEGNYVDVRHILVQVKGGTAAEDGSMTYSEEEWETCRQAAQDILDQWLAGDQTEDAFAELANTSSEDPGSNTNGGLYENVYMGQMVAPFEEWCFDESRQYGDYGLVQTSYGYHVMFYVGSEPIWLSYAEQDLVQTQVNLFIEEVAKGYPMEVYYDKIQLGYINMAG